MVKNSAYQAAARVVEKLKGRLNDETGALTQLYIHVVLFGQYLSITAVRGSGLILPEFLEAYAADPCLLPRAIKEALEREPQLLVSPALPRRGQSEMTLFASELPEYEVFL